MLHNFGFSLCRCEESGEKGKATDCYQSAVDLNPDYQEAKLALQRLTKASRRVSEPCCDYTVQFKISLPPEIIFPLLKASVRDKWV